MQNARRISLQKYEIDGSDGALIAQIEMPRGLWTANGAPLADAISGAGFGENPVLKIGEKTYEIHRDLLTDKLVVNRYSIYVKDDAGRKIIEATAPVEKRSSLICYNETEFLVTARSIFAFDYDVTSNDSNVARFKDVSPFLTFSSRRLYHIETEAREIEPLLLAFSFFLAVLIAY